MIEVALPQVALSVSTYLQNLSIYLMWVLSDAMCLAVGWTGILFLNDAAATYTTC
jgi:hypothetical protein